jgi:hypothetical protein
MPRLIILGILSAAIISAGGAGATADTLVPAVKACKTRNCGALVLPGRINAHPEVPALSSPWVGEVAGAAGSCLRLEIVAQRTDLAMTVVGPDGRLFTSDDGGAATCVKCPRVVVGAARAGVYTIVVNTRTGLPAETDFDLRAGLYATGNANCAKPTKGS